MIDARTKRRIVSLNELPTRQECLDAMAQLEAEEEGSWRGFCRANGIYQVVHDDLVDGLHRLISGLSPIETAEVGAGNGKLAYWLCRKGLNVRATDDHSWNGIARPDFVEKLDHTGALGRYNPDVVIACFPDEKGTIPVDVLRHRSTRYLIHLGNAERPSWSEEIALMTDVVSRELPGVCTYPAFDDDRGMNRCVNVLYEVKR